ncbi:MAG TPA: PepSY-associated TM helix domain-containing protein [Bacteroidales bacterium]|nr:PepSY-associated TM helix domain-containing protein [Bacteroidales bacterium]
MAGKNFNSLIRWVHIYLSMFGFTALFFFAVTGITLNHPGWMLGKQKAERVTGTIDPAWADGGDITAEARDLIVEKIRNAHNIRARLTDFRIDDFECSVSFSGPGYNADAFIERSTGQYDLTVTSAGFIAVLNDLHKGSDTGTQWATVIDISAIIMILVSLTGFVMIFCLSKRKLPGLIVAAIGALTFIVLCIVLN